ncbi:hypothetical protein JI750_01060 [Flavobacterium sp. GN10]|uniref:Uncharacterized protein n=1 Tax=Flavobacterium tagetis TaxID=2801336 RepID=A0ABS1K7J5_9FLAO|nr:hypothetical protein [Flavobacterium tagetis]MBL0735459.1 hypothetical protein [Flavobacterium tagetis]
MKKVFTFITISILISACKKTENNATSTISKIKTDSVALNHSASVAASDSEALLDLFTKRKKEIVLKLKSISAEESNALYEKYFEENSTLLQEIAGKESPVLDRFYNEDEADKKAVKLLGEKLSKHQLQFWEIGEGYVEIEPLHDFYYTIFKDYITSDYKDYLYLKSEENKTLYSADAGLVISFKDLGDRVISWGKLYDQIPKFKTD